MKTWMLYSLINTALGALFGMFILINSNDSDKLLMFISTLLSSFFISALIWKIAVQQKSRLPMNKIVLLGLLVGTISHYSTFVFWGFIRLICYSITGNSTSSLGEPPNLFGVFVAPIPFTFLTIIFYGWITVPLAIFGGYLTKKRIDKRT